MHSYQIKNLWTTYATKVTNKLIDLRNKYIPHNSQFRAKAVCATTQEYASQSEDTNFQYFEIYTDCISKVSVPESLFKALSAHHIHDELDAFETRTFTITSDYIVAVIPQGRLYTNNSDTIAYLTKDDCLLNDVSYQWKAYHADDQQNINRVFINRYFTTPKKYKGTVFSMVAGSSAVWNYSHWLLDALPRLHLLKKAGLFDKVDYFVVPAYKYDFQKDSLQLLGIGPEKIIVAGNQTHLVADTLIAASHPRGKKSYINPSWLVEFLHKAFAENNPSLTTYPPYIYISRKDAAYRYVENENEVMQLLDYFDFKSYTLSNLPFAEKVKLFYSAKIIVSISGAGLNNFAFCQPGTKVVEMFAEGFVHTIFCDIAQKAGLEYYPLIYKTGSTAKSQKEGMIENITVDVNDLQVLMDNFFHTYQDSPQSASVSAMDSEEFEEKPKLF